MKPQWGSTNFLLRVILLSTALELFPGSRVAIGVSPWAAQAIVLAVNVLVELAHDQR